MNATDTPLKPENSTGPWRSQGSTHELHAKVEQVLEAVVQIPGCMQLANPELCVCLPLPAAGHPTRTRARTHTHTLL